MREEAESQPTRGRADCRLELLGVIDDQVVAVAIGRGSSRTRPSAARKPSSSARLKVLRTPAAPFPRSACRILRRQLSLLEAPLAAEQRVLVDVRETDAARRDVRDDPPAPERRRRDRDCRSRSLGSSAASSACGFTRRLRSRLRFSARRACCVDRRSRVLPPAIASITCRPSNASLQYSSGPL